MSSPDAAFSDQETSQHSADADSADSSLAISAKKSSRRPAYKRDCAGQFQLPRWYRGNMLPREVTRKVGQVGSLRGLEFGIMDEILCERMTNREYCAADISRYLGVDYRSLPQAFWMHNLYKIEFGMLAPNTSIRDPQIKPRRRIWESYRKFIDQGGCSEPFHPQVLAAVLFPKLNYADKEGYVIQQSLKGGPLPEWSGNWRQGGPAKLAAQVSGIVPSSGEGDKPFPPSRLPRPPPPPPSRGTAAAGAAEGSTPAGGTSDAAIADRRCEGAVPTAREGALLPRPTYPRHCRGSVAALSPQWPHTFGPSSLFPMTPAEALRARPGQLHGLPDSPFRLV